MTLPGVAEASGFSVRIDRAGDAFVFSVEPYDCTIEMVGIDSVPGVIALVIASDPGAAAQRAWLKGEAEGQALAKLGGMAALLATAKSKQVSGASEPTPSAPKGEPRMRELSDEYEPPPGKLTGVCVKCREPRHDHYSGPFSRPGQLHCSKYGVPRKAEPEPPQPTHTCAIDNDCAGCKAMMARRGEQHGAEAYIGDTLKALQNMGHDTTCGACMSIAFTGAANQQHTCKPELLFCKCGCPRILHVEHHAHSKFGSPLHLCSCYDFEEPEPPQPKGEAALTLRKAKAFEWVPGGLRILVAMSDADAEWLCTSGDLYLTLQSVQGMGLAEVVLDSDKPEPPQSSEADVLLTVTPGWIAAMRAVLHGNPEALEALSELERRRGKL